MRTVSAILLLALWFVLLPVRGEKLTLCLVRTALVVWGVLLLSGCVTAPVRLDNAARLMARPDWPAARSVAPEWCRDALKTINALELDQERR